MDGKQLQNQYKNHLSDYHTWDQLNHAEEYILYPKNIGCHLCIDETALSKEELYTVLINRDKKGRKGSIIALIKGIKAEDVIKVLMLIDIKLRNMAYRWQVMKDENNKIREAKAKGNVMIWKCFVMGIHLGNCWSEAGTCYSRRLINGLPAKSKERRFYLAGSWT